MLGVKIERVPYERKVTLRNLLALYQYDFSEMTRDDVNDAGFFEYKYLDHYWTDSNRFPYFILYGGKLAGFALVRRIFEGEKEYYSMAEFFILRKYRRNSTGIAAAGMVFNLHPGNWQLSVIEQNHKAKAFWDKTITQCCNGCEKIVIESEDGTIFSFRACGNSV
ncbi:GNAT family N-acetyltransferase [Peribacillus sp. SCS-37]|uniref:GNAT family N-acetyltransferase n=1 Tax=Paraperibacillus esterisolvens TaxID=3115296 RepID=UPI0039060E30